MTENQENLRPKTGKSFRADLDALAWAQGNGPREAFGSSLAEGPLDHDPGG